jgi:hypothetical protein
MVSVLEVVTVVALVAGPVLAVEVQKRSERQREQRSRRLGIFRTLMATRLQNLGSDHVQALNVIDVEFYGSSPEEKAILNAWKAYLDHLNQDTQLNGWGARRVELFVDLLYSMSVHLGYDFDKVHLKNQAYSPMAHGNLEAQNAEIRKGVIDVLAGKVAIPIRPAEARPVPPAEGPLPQPSLPPTPTS